MAIFSKLWGRGGKAGRAAEQAAAVVPVVGTSESPRVPPAGVGAGGWVVEHSPAAKASASGGAQVKAASLPVAGEKAERKDAVRSKPSVAPESEGKVQPVADVVPLEAVQPAVPEAGWWPQTKALAKYLAGTEVHTYAFSVAANVILSLFPFIVLMLTVAQRVFHSPAMVNVLSDLMHSLLPTSQDFVMNNMKVLANPKKGTKLFSVFMLLVTSTGVFLPLEVALNNVWGVKKHRNYLENQVVSLGLAAAVGVLVLASVALTAGQRSVMSWIFLGHTDNVVFEFIAHSVLRFCAVVASILLFFLIYWVLPHRKIPAMAVLPTAIVVGLSWEVAKYLYVLLLPKLDFAAVYGPFRVSVGLMMWAFLSGLMLLAGAHFSATRYTLRLAREEEQAGRG